MARHAILLRAAALQHPRTDRASDETNGWPGIPLCAESVVMAGRIGIVSRLMVAAFLMCASLGSPAHADKRVALVIGNSAYQNVNPLPNPAKDGAAMADMLKKAGFDVVNSKQDVTNSDMRRMVRDFSDQARSRCPALAAKRRAGQPRRGRRGAIVDPPGR